MLRFLLHILDWFSWGTPLLGWGLSQRTIRSIRSGHGVPRPRHSIFSGVTVTAHAPIGHRPTPSRGGGRSAPRPASSRAGLSGVASAPRQALLLSLLRGGSSGGGLGVPGRNPYFDAFGNKTISVDLFHGEPGTKVTDFPLKTAQDRNANDVKTAIAAISRISDPTGFNAASAALEAKRREIELNHARVMLGRFSKSKGFGSQVLPGVNAPRNAEPFGWPGTKYLKGDYQPSTSRMR